MLDCVLISRFIVHKYMAKIIGVDYCRRDLDSREDGRSSVELAPVLRREKAAPLRAVPRRVMLQHVV